MFFSYFRVRKIFLLEILPLLTPMETILFPLEKSFRRPLCSILCCLHE